MQVGKLLLVALLGASVVQASDWARFRGPNGSGVAETGRLPVVFGPGTNSQWDVTVPPGKSSAVLSADRLYLTAAEDGELLTLAFDRATGRELWRRAAPSRRVERMNRLNHEASSTPVTDGTNVYVFFGGYGMLAYGPDGDQLWALPLGPFTNYHGMAASPILADGKLIMVCDQDLEA